MAAFAAALPVATAGVMLVVVDDVAAIVVGSAVLCFFSLPMLVVVAVTVLRMSLGRSDSAQRFKDVGTVAEHREISGPPAT